MRRRLKGRLPIFSGRDMEVYGYARSAHKPLLVTFTHMNRDEPHRFGFGEAFLRKERFSAIHFVSTWNHFWQTSESLPAASAVAASTLFRDARGVITYGSSMGGTGALLFSGALDADRVIAISPQMSVDAAKAPFESRFDAERDAIVEAEGFVFDDMAAQLGSGSKVYIAYDPETDDEGHFQLIRALAPELCAIPIPGAGHPAGRLLRELDLLGTLVTEIASGIFDAEAFSSTIEQARLTR